MSFGQFAEVLTIARLVDNYELDATGATALWPADTTYVATVPADKRWFFIGGVLNRDVSGTLLAELYNADDKLVLQLAYAGAATGKTAYPNTVESGTSMNPTYKIPMDPGWYIKVTLGASQSTAAEGSCVVLEIPYP